jgi:uncharacterized protein (DUF3820 family)
MAAGVRMPWGKYRDKPLAEVPLSYLAWCLEQGYPRPALRAAIAAELAVRLNLPRPDPPPPPGPVPVPRQPAARDIVRAGFRSAAGRAHPDHAGSDTAMREILAAREALERVLG